MELNRSSSIDGLVAEIFDEFRDHFSRGRGLAPVLFMHGFDGSPEPGLLEMLPLDGEEQASWPEVIEEAVQRTGAALWALATQVEIRRGSATAPRSEVLFVYLLADAAHPEGARVWASSVAESGSIAPAVERTDDPNLQMMIAQLTGRRLLH